MIINLTKINDDIQIGTVATQTKIAHLWKGQPHHELTTLLHPRITHLNWTVFQFQTKYQSRLHPHGSRICTLPHL